MVDITKCSCECIMDKVCYRKTAASDTQQSYADFHQICHSENNYNFFYGKKELKEGVVNSLKPIEENKDENRTPDDK